MTVHPILSLNPIPGLLCECTFYFECLCELKPSSGQTGYQVNKVQVPATGVRTWILGVHGFRGQKLHRPFRIGWGSTESLCVSFCKNSTGLPLWGVGKEENDRVRAVFATMLCVCVFMWVPIKALVEFLLPCMASCMYIFCTWASARTHTCGEYTFLTGWPWGHSGPALTSLAPTGDTAPGTQSPPCLATSNSWHG